ncbi:hypothetical protein JG687_00000527 [Phytophthora cactorum]|uniref:WW domain-containing protein n=1 Tax=Phytophthora cactorum TaxID=29920 RepID=A0A329SZB4_9STRA|nr:hypothetical protein PC117_g3531 [Phytophthora cactorum]KAG3032634.1 hypothetical protein PC120_g2375 [Phytophthora cactorum]KAG3038003.1 hypothetical protein PC119_g3152 [Phytophthora cactorum]KAG3092916.1 hypothetical protein PC121_g3427 [Phytophthora cactorum]KAG3201499.1 hypothetical protein PC128_g3836 [Phytophthora cactorum]
MATRGVNGAASGTLNERFIRCEGCRVNVPKEDMLALGKCTVCGRPYEAVVTADGRGIEVETVAFDGVGAAVVEKKPSRKRWAVLTSKRGRAYYHNTETGEDRWDKPADLDADAVEDAFVPFKNDAVKKAVLREQMKLEATKMGVPMEVVAASQQQLQQEAEADDPFAKMVGRGGKPKNKSSPVQASNPKQNIAVPTPTQVEEEEEEEDKETAQDTAKAGGSCIVM